MNPVRETIGVRGSFANVEAVHLLLTQGDVALLAEDPEQVMQNLEARASVMSSTLAGILLEPHGRPDWGLNE